MQITDAERKARRNQRIRERRERLKAEDPEAYQQQREREREIRLKSKKKNREKKKSDAAFYCRHFDPALRAERLNRYLMRTDTLSLQEVSQMLGLPHIELIVGGINGIIPRPIGVGSDGTVSYEYESIRKYAKQRKDG